MHIFRKVTLAVAAVVLAAAPVLGHWDPTDPAKWVQLPDPNGWDVKATMPKILADDFLCTRSLAITDIHFWGSWQQDQIGQISGVWLGIYSDDPVGPGGGDPGNIYSKPDQLAWSWETDDFSIRPVDPPSSQGWYDPNTGLYMKPDHQQYFQYNVLIPKDQAFVQRGTTADPVVYWLSIQVQTASGEWGWKTSAMLWNDDAVWADWSPGMPAPSGWQELRDPLTGDSLDLAFVITPEPASLLLLALGGCALLRRRR